MTLQDLAQLKIEIGNPEDACLHLQQSEKELRSTRVDDEMVSSLVLTATIDRNLELSKVAQLGRQRKLEEVAARPMQQDSNEERKLQARQERLSNVLMASGAFLFGFMVVKLFISRSSPQ